MVTINSCISLPSKTHAHACKGIVFFSHESLKECIWPKDRANQLKCSVISHQSGWFLFQIKLTQSCHWRAAWPHPEYKVQVWNQEQLVHRPLMQSRAQTKQRYVTSKCKLTVMFQISEPGASLANCRKQPSDDWPFVKTYDCMD